MKRLIIYVLFLNLFISLTACKKEMMEYEGREGVYFAVQHGTSTAAANRWPYQPFSDVEFVRIGAPDIELPIKVAITGPTKDYDRTFKVAINQDSTTAIPNQHYEPIKEEWIIPKGAISTIIKIKLKRTPDLEITPVTLGLKLIPTDQLSLSFPEWDAIPSLNGGTVVPKFDASLHTLRINDIMVQPAIWRGSIQAGNREGGVFGAFSREKMEFFIANCGVTYEDFSSDATMPIVRSILLSRDAAAILKALFDAKTPILEKDGRLMWVEGVPWTSNIGVPWVRTP